MPIDTLRQVLRLSPHDEQATLHLASLVDGDVPVYQRVQVTEEVLTEFKHAAAREVGHISGLYDDGDLEVLPYDGGTKPDSHQVEYVHLPDHPAVHMQLASLRDQEGLLPIFQAEDPFVKGLRFYVVGVHPTEGTDVFFLRAYTKKKELKLSKGFGAWFRDGQFNQIVEPLFLFDHGIDCIVVDDYLFILRKAMFHRIFRFIEKVEEAARDNLERIKEVVPIANYDAFSANCVGHTQKMYKLNVIVSKPYLDRITMDILAETIEFHRLDIDIEGEGDDRRLVYDDNNRWGILKLLDDDYLESRLTGNIYESNSKRKRSRSAA